MKLTAKLLRQIISEEARKPKAPQSRNLSAEELRHIIVTEAAKLTSTSLLSEDIATLQGIVDDKVILKRKQRSPVGGPPPGDPVPKPMPKELTPEEERKNQRQKNDQAYAAYKKEKDAVSPAAKALKGVFDRYLWPAYIPGPNGMMQVPGFNKAAELIRDAIKKKRLAALMHQYYFHTNDHLDEHVTYWLGQSKEEEQAKWKNVTSLLIALSREIEDEKPNQSIETSGWGLAGTSTHGLN